MSEQENSLPPVTRLQDTDAALESVLVSLAKALKAITFYPAEHPQRNECIAAACKQLKLLLQEQEILLLWNREACTVGNRTALRSSSITAKSLAREMLTRKLQKLIILPELTENDLQAFLTLIANEANLIHEGGGIEAAMMRAGITTLGANEVDLAVLHNLQQKKEEKPDEESATLSPEEEMSQAAGSPDAPVIDDPEGIGALLSKLVIETEEQPYMQLVRAVLDAAEKLKRRESFSPLLNALKILLGELSSEARPDPQKEYVRYALEQITDGTMTTFLLDQLEQRVTGNEDLLDRLCAAIGKKLAYPLIQRLCIAESLHIRKIIAGALTRTGKNGVPAIITMLKDERWYVVRNMVTILGEIAAPDSLNALQITARHPEPKVRKEVIKSLLKISPQAADKTLIELLKDQDNDVVRQAIYSLGAIRSRAAVAPLLDIVSASDTFLKEISVKKQAIMSLGRIGDRQATSVLLDILSSRRWLAPGRWQEIKISAATALGQMGDESAIPLLKRFAEAGTPLGVACSDAADNLERLAK